jgi:predicted TIM-barrel fold metal-dependent hydrolase
VIIDMRLRPPTKSWIEKPQFVKGSPFYPTRIGFPRPPSAEQRSMSLLLEEMDQAGITFGVSMGRQSAEPLGVIPNEEIRDTILAHPNRFFGFAGIDVRHSAGACIAEIERCLTWRGFVGVSIEPGASNPAMKADDHRLYPIYEACQDRDIPISVSLSGLLSTMVGADVEYSSPMPLYRVARDFPKLAIIISHAAWPWVQEVLGLAFVCQNIFVSPDLYINGTDMPFAAEFIKAANLYLADRLLFGTAYPSRPLVESVQAFNEWSFKPGVKEKVLGRNAATLLKLAA